jgi:hypothetical protein
MAARQFGSGITRTQICRRVVFAFTLLTVACAPLYPVQIAQTGKDTYVASQASASTWLDAKTAAIQRAGKFCEKQGKRIEVITGAQERSTFGLASNDHATVAFRCVSPDS